MAANRFLKFVRQFHLYLGVFAAPALLFFAISGGIQTFSLHMRIRGSSYQPPAWVVRLGMLHRKQTLSLAAPRPMAAPSPAAGSMAGNTAMPTSSPGQGHDLNAAQTPPAAASGGQEHPAPPAHLLPMRIYFGVIALALMLSTFSGVYMSYRYTRKPAWISLTLAAGIAVPLILLLI